MLLSLPSHGDGFDLARQNSEPDKTQNGKGSPGVTAHDNRSRNLAL